MRSDLPEVEEAKGKGAEGSPYFQMTDAAYLKMRRDYAIRQRRIRWQSHSWIFWLLDIDPEDIYSEAYPRSSAQSARRHWLRAHVSWAFLGRFQGSFGAYVAAGIPITMLLINAAPELKGKVSAHPFGWVFLACMAWLAALVIYQLRCPKLLKEVLRPTVNTGSQRREMLRAYVEAEFDHLIDTQPWDLHPHLIDPEEPGVHRTALALRARGGTPVFTGYGAYAQSLIERALFDWSVQQSVRILVEQPDRGLYPLDSPRRHHYLGSHQPAVCYLRIRHPDSLHLEAQPEYRPTDLIMDWTDAPLQVLEWERDEEERLNQRKFVTEGLLWLFIRDNSAESFASLVSQWTHWQRRPARSLILALYALTLCFASIFILKEGSEMVRAMLQ